MTRYSWRLWCQEELAPPFATSASCCHTYLNKMEISVVQQVSLVAAYVKKDGWQHGCGEKTFLGDAVNIVGNFFLLVRFWKLVCLRKVATQVRMLPGSIANIRLCPWLVCFCAESTDVIFPIVNPKYQTCLIIVRAILKSVQAVLKVHGRSVNPPVRYFSVQSLNI